MPQPLSRINPEARITIGRTGERPFARHPELATLAIEAIASWSNVESFMLYLFVALFGGPGSLAADVFLSLQGRPAKSAAIRAAAKSVLKTRHRELKILNAILLIVKENEPHRNKLAHWAWGDSEDLTDALLLVDPRDCLLGDVDKSKIFVYKPTDFISIIDANNRLCDCGVWFRFVIEGHPGIEKEQLLNEISRRPEIRDALERLAQKSDGLLKQVQTLKPRTPSKVRNKSNTSLKSNL